jgi:hypothetical protein
MTDVNLNRSQPMVAWFRPGLLFRAAFHHIVAGIFGQYADQRTIQQLEDPIPDQDDVKKAFVHRYDYSNEAPNSEPFWVDYTSDLGDGFDSTYSVAYLLAAKHLSGTTDPETPKIRGVENLGLNENLKAGRILVMGGDQVYPWPSREAYADRLQMPYGWACPEPQVDPMTQTRGRTERDVFAIPGNHDWYDGLNAFDGLFCRARGERGAGDRETIGGWQTRQHRSYFAIKLPHNWWIWGADIQLSRYLDAGQLRYFRTVSEQMGPEDKFILCTAQPTWLYFGTPAESFARTNLRNLIDMPIRKGAKLCTILSGDTHHYSRYVEDDHLGGFNLFTAGGGGAYCHGTHHLKDDIEFDWVGRPLTFRLDRKQKPAPASDGTTAPAHKTSHRACYPNRIQSCWKAVSNISFPFRNLAFAFAMGAIYWLLTWSLSEIQVYPQFEIQEKEQAKIIRNVEDYQRQHEMMQQRRAPSEFKDKYFRRIPKSGERPRSRFDRSPRPLDDSPPSPSRSATPEALQESDADAATTDAAPNILQPIRTWTLARTKYYIEKTKGMPIFSTDHLIEYGQLMLYSGALLLLGLASSPGATIFIFLVWLIFFRIADTKRLGRTGLASRFFSGTIHFALHLTLMWSLYSWLTYWNQETLLPYLQQVSRDWGGDGTFLLLAPVEVWTRAAYIPQMVIIGGLAAGLLFGLYLTVTYILGRVNTDWVFSAQGSPDYRNFLRMKLEPNRLTIYPIGLDRPPQRRWWWPFSAAVAWAVTPDPKPGAPKVEPRVPLRPRLIEGPIVINANQLQNIPRG